MWRGGGRGTSPPASSCCKGFPVSAGCGRSFPARGGGPPKVVEGHGRSSVTYKEDRKHLACPPTILRLFPPPPKGRIGKGRFPPHHRQSHSQTPHVRLDAQPDKIQSHIRIPYTCLCLQKKNKDTLTTTTTDTTPH